MPRVYVINEPLRRNHDTGELERTIDLSPATAFGELSFLLHSGQLPQDPSPTVEVLRRKLADYTANDFLLPVGHPAMIGWATALAARASGGEVKMLCWYPPMRRYLVTKVRLWDPGDAP